MPLPPNARLPPSTLLVSPLTRPVYITPLVLPTLPVPFVPSYVRVWLLAVIVSAAWLMLPWAVRVVTL